MQVERSVQPCDIVRTARERLGCSQREFARTVGSQQSLICKYERGAIDPPSPLVIQCMNLLELSALTWVSEGELVALVRSKLSGKDMGAARYAIAQLIRCLPGVSVGHQGDVG